MGTHELTCGQFHLQGSATASTGACLAGTKLRNSKKVCIRIYLGIICGVFYTSRMYTGIVGFMRLYVGAYEVHVEIGASRRHLE